MREDVRQALAIDAPSSADDRTIDITTSGRRTGEPRRIEIVFYRLGDDVYLSGIPGPTTRNWLANLAANPEFTFHLKHGVVADLPATATVIVDAAERRRVLAVFVEEFNHRNGPDSPWPTAVLESGWLAVRWPGSPSRAASDRAPEGASLPLAPTLNRTARWNQIDAPIRMSRGHGRASPWIGPRPPQLGRFGDDLAGNPGCDALGKRGR
ncbi:MAG: nitroreductase family deazaflavin-dependent oxidoreductase [Candidatus Dormibacteraeota bacterium]|uniref:Nitroreductase family deazaflavin-dependent oxidoreductase n=1 Tax=Candidatus Amunia macphersoniae TaxID=3127014 RepID=A0A934NF07_9BACT|nr:nitroreductase family deazaflavin-dependent oxidoreductase [Candidatus Dormibacteraeota bacterium]